MTPGEVRNLDPNRIILIPERQNPILVDRIVYYQDACFKPIFEAQKGPLLYPDAMRTELDELKARVISLQEARVAYPPAEDAAKGKKGKAKKQPEPPLASEVADEEHAEKVRKATAARASAALSDTPAPAAPAPDDELAKADVVPVKKPALARDVGHNEHGSGAEGGEDREPIKPNIEAADAMMSAFNGRLKAKLKAAAQVALLVIEAGTCDGDQCGTRPHVGRGMGVL